MTNKLLSVAKALVATLTAFLGSLVVAVQDGSGLSTYEWLAAALVAVTTLGAVYSVPNLPLNKTHDA